MDVIRGLFVIFVGLVIMLTPMAITMFFVISRDPQHLMGRWGTMLYIASLGLGLAIVWIADRLLNRH